ncbi:glucosylceramidase [Fibrella aestuarina BUZ 2]|uniref:Glucosylceramidase n=1 Tax=Fibrella aestuarina BUZ 2 TaxID=1166018 RepID=I0K7X1_9BACT|nr:glycoside hydrolase family 30 beta sandwich domain-containing protein [Fibrella aestuarina]CCH00224.1 glucosylceramidase [Fibrella aestuarina BUZ 2]
MTTLARFRHWRRWLALPVWVTLGGSIAPCQTPSTAPTTSARADVACWLTAPALNLFFQQQKGFAFSPTASQGAVIEVDTTQTFQSMDGFGYTLTGGSAMLINRLKPDDRAALLRELISPDGIGISYLRISIGASDLSDRVFTYDDVPAGETDLTLSRFSLEPERADLLPVLKQMLAINPRLTILATPWTPPVWMKTNGSSKGGSLKPACYDVYAQYFVRYVQAMQAEGIPIDAVTIQNEPLHPGNNPSLLMTSAEQADFLKKSLGPAFRKAGLSTKIILYDHNADHPEYVTDILADREAAQYADGSAFHLYNGPISALGKVHDQFPTKNLYFTEQWTGAKGTFQGDLNWHVRNLIIGAPRNWCRTVLEWNLAADPALNPHTDGGCTECLGALTIDGNRITRNVAYYIIAHASKVVRPGSVRIGSTELGALPSVAFKTPDGKKVLIVQNERDTPQTVTIRQGRRSIIATLPGGSVGTYVW